MGSIGVDQQFSRAGRGPAAAQRRDLVGRLCVQVVVGGHVRQHRASGRGRPVRVPCATALARDEPGRGQGRRAQRGESQVSGARSFHGLCIVFSLPGSSRRFAVFSFILSFFRCVVFSTPGCLFLLGTHRDAVGAYSIILQFDARVRVQENHVIAVALFFRFNHPGVPFAADATEHACR